jgi:hypothetical protein
MVTSNDLGNDYNIGYRFSEQCVWTVSIYGSIEYICASERRAIERQKELFDAEFKEIYINGPEDTVSDTVIDEVMNDEIHIERVKLDE